MYFSTRSLVLLGTLLLAPALALVARAEAAEVLSPTTIWNLVTADPNDDTAGPDTGYGDRLRRNGTWPDIGVWNRRPEAVRQPATRVRAISVRSGSTPDLTMYELINVDRSTEKLAYIDSSSTGALPVNGLSAFVFTTRARPSHVTNRWTVTKDKFGRRVLGEGARTDDVHGPAWVELGPNWCTVQRGDCPDTEFCNDGYCDGLSYKLCGTEDICFGRPTRLVLVEVKKPGTSSNVLVWQGDNARE